MQHMLPHTTGVCVCVCVFFFLVFGRRFKSINIFFPIQGEKFPVSQQVSSCMDVRMCVYVAVCVCACVCVCGRVLKRKQTQDLYSLTVCHSST